MSKFLIVLCGVGSVLGASAFWLGAHHAPDVPAAPAALAVSALQVPVQVPNTMATSNIGSLSTISWVLLTSKVMTVRDDGVAMTTPGPIYGVTSKDACVRLKTEMSRWSYEPRCEPVDTDCRWPTGLDDSGSMKFAKSDCNAH